MEHQEKDGDENSAKSKTSLKPLARISGDGSSGSEILTKRKRNSLQGDLFNPIKKLVKLEAELQDGYKLQIEISIVKDENPNANAALVKQEEANINENPKILDRFSQIASKEHSLRIESNQICSQKQAARTEDSGSSSLNKDRCASLGETIILTKKQKFATQMQK